MSMRSNPATRPLSIVRENPVHVAILDIRMAGQSGIEVLRQMKALSPSIEVIMLTAYETLETARQAIRLGACDYLNKPFDIATIRESVKRAARLREISDNISSTFERFNALTGELQDANLREEMARTANEIYAGVLHDINNPLTIISGFTEMLEMQLSRSSVLSGSALEEARGKLNIISKQVSTCGAITTRYLKLLNSTSDERPIHLGQPDPLRPDLAAQVAPVDQVEPTGGQDARIRPAHLGQQHRVDPGPDQPFGQRLSEFHPGPDGGGGGHPPRRTGGPRQLSTGPDTHLLHQEIFENRGPDPEHHRFPTRARGFPANSSPVFSNPTSPPRAPRAEPGSACPSCPV